MAISDDYKELTGMIKSMDSDIKSLSDLADSTIIGIYELNPSIKDVLVEMSKDDLDAISEISQINDILEKGRCDIEAYKSTWNALNGDDESKYIHITMKATTVM